MFIERHDGIASHLIECHRPNGVKYRIIAMSTILKHCRKSFRHWLNLRAQRKLVRSGALVLANSSSVLAQRILYKTGCRVEIGASSSISCSIVFDRIDASIRIGSRTFIGDSSLVAASGIDVGDDVLISWGCTIVDHNSHSTRFSERREDVMAWMSDKKDWTHVKIQPVIIGNKAWVGFGANILKGVHIGEGAIIGAGSVVTKNVPAWTVVGGNPARVIRVLKDDER